MRSESNFLDRQDGFDAVLYNLWPMTITISEIKTLRWNTNVYNYIYSGLKYNFQDGGTVQLSAPVRSRAHVSIAGSQIINDRLNVLSMISCRFFLIL